MAAVGPDRDGWLFRLISTPRHPLSFPRAALAEREEDNLGSELPARASSGHPR